MPSAMIMVPPRHFCRIANPVRRDAGGQPVTIEYGQVVLNYGDAEYRFEGEPFPLYPGEKLDLPVGPLQVVPDMRALRLQCVRDFDKHSAGDEYLFHGPGTYIPRVEEEVLDVVDAVVVNPNTALKLRARRNTEDQDGQRRDAGEEWLWRRTGAFLPGVDEEIVETVRATILTEERALRLRARRAFVDVYGQKRAAGEEWLVTLSMAEAHIPDVNEQLDAKDGGVVRITTLSNRQFCVVCNPVDVRSGVAQLGGRELRKGPLNFFLRPGESLENGIQDVYVLGPEEALLLRADEAMNEEEGEPARKPGDRWMIVGPREYIPAITVSVLEKRRVIPLDENEGVYVRNLDTGAVRAHIGESFLLKPNEALWAKELPESVEQLLFKEQVQNNLRGRTHSSSASASASASASSAALKSQPVNSTVTAAAEGYGSRDKHRVVTYRVQQGAAVQIYDYFSKKARVVFGPDLILLQPDEQFTVLNLSGDVPKRPGMIRSLSLLLGPDFMTDVVVVETSDHARLSLKLAYNWHFEVDPAEPGRIFSVQDFVGDAAKAIASRVRGAVAMYSFDRFHRDSASIIRTAVFGTEKDTQTVRAFLRFASNGLVVDNVDIQSVEPVDQRTRDSLQKSVQLAIEITTKSQEARARQEAAREEQLARGKLERQRFSDQAEAEAAREELLRLQAATAMMEAKGHAVAEAEAEAKKSLMAAESAVEQAEFQAQAERIRFAAELDQLKRRNAADLDRRQRALELELSNLRQMADIEVRKFSQIVAAMGPETIVAMAQAGPEMQSRLLKGLGVKSIMITDGNSPINLFSTAKGLIGAGSKSSE